MSHKNTQATTQSMPAHIMLDKWADSGFAWQGQVTLDQLPRLAASLSQAAQAQPLEVLTRLTKHEGILYLSNEVGGALPLDCQRCLSLMHHEVSGIYRTALLSDAAQVAQVADEEYLFLSELGTDNRLSIRDLLEDELLLALPLSPRHEDCQMLTDSVGDLPAEEVKPNPFAVLAELKNKN